MTARGLLFQGAGDPEENASDDSSSGLSAQGEALMTEASPSFILKSWIRLLRYEFNTSYTL